MPQLSAPGRRLLGPGAPEIESFKRVALITVANVGEFTGKELVQNTAHAQLRILRIYRPVI